MKIDKTKIKKRFTALILLLLAFSTFCYGGGYLRNIPSPGSNEQNYSSSSAISSGSSLMLNNDNTSDKVTHSEDNNTLEGENNALPNQVENDEKNLEMPYSGSASANNFNFADSTFDSSDSGTVIKNAESPDTTDSETKNSEYILAGSGSEENKNGSGNGALSCTISVNCSTVLNHLDSVSDSAKSVIPESGWVMSPIAVSFKSGETVFDVLKRTAHENAVHLEFVNTAAYDSTYIEGIGNLYEFDCGELSGWSYRVNGTFPSYSSSKYTLSAGDNIEWLYTCDLGKDIGGNNVTGNDQ